MNLFALCLCLTAGLIGASPAAAPLEMTDVFVEHTGGYFAYRIPALETASDGSLLIFAEARKYSLVDAGVGDQDVDLVYRRSRDGGKTWSPMKVIEDPGELWSAASPATVVDRTNGRIWLIYQRCKPRCNENTARPGTDDCLVLARSSDDHGESWSEPIDLTRVSRDYDDPKWRLTFVGPGGMIQDRRGRFVAACYKHEPFNSFALFSEDHGKSWQRSAFVPGDGKTECQLVELADGRLLMDIRQENGTSRYFSLSEDGGKTWSNDRAGLPAPTVACGLQGVAFDGAGDGRGGQTGAVI